MSQNYQYYTPWEKELLRNLSINENAIKTKASRLGLGNIKDRHDSLLELFNIEKESLTQDIIEDFAEDNENSVRDGRKSITYKKQAKKCGLLFYRSQPDFIDESILTEDMGDAYVFTENGLFYVERGKNSKLSVKFKFFRSRSLNELKQKLGLLKDPTNIHQRLENNHTFLNHRQLEEITSFTGHSRFSISDNDWLQTATLYTALSWFTSTRLFIQRLNRVADLAQRFKEGANKNLGFLPSWIKFFGLSYGLELIVDLSIICKNTFSETEKTKAFNSITRCKKAFDRCKNSFLKDKRPARMMNAVVWFGINLACLFLTAGVSGWVNIAGCIVDVGLEFFKIGLQRFRENRLIKKIDADIAAKENKRNNLENRLIKKKTIIYEEFLKKNQAAGLEIDALKLYRDQVKEESRQKLKKAIYPIIVTTLILATTALLFAFPPLTLPALIGAGVALAAGSVVFGFCRRVVDNLIDKYNSRKYKEELHPIDFSKKEPQNTSSSTLTCKRLFNPVANGIKLSSPALLPPIADSSSPSIIVTLPSEFNRTPVMPIPSAPFSQQTGLSFAGSAKTPVMPIPSGSSYQDVPAISSSPSTQSRSKQ